MQAVLEKVFGSYMYLQEKLRIEYICILAAHFNMLSNEMLSLPVLTSFSTSRITRIKRKEYAL